MLLGRQLVGDETTKRLQVVAGNAGEHVVLDVIFHVPVKEGVEGIENRIAATDPEIRVIAHGPSMEERGLGDMKLIELVRILDDDAFMAELQKFDHVLFL